MDPKPAAVRRDPHDVFNQPPPLENYNLFTCDAPLRDGLRREGGAWGEPLAREYGARLGRAELLELGALANRNPPILHTHDRFGHRIDTVEYHPAYHDLMRIGVEAQTHSLPWINPRPGVHVVRAVLMMLRHQVEEGTSCPLTMTFAAVPALNHQPDLAAEWLPRLLSNEYDPAFAPASQKRGALMGMALTERQGGSDVQSNTTWAAACGAGGPGAEYELTGHKWFCSAPMCDAFLTLAQTENGLSCFLLPRWKPDGTLNAFHIVRLKDKLGNRSNASSEIELNRAWARMVGEDGRGVQTIIEMIWHTRLDCVFGSTAGMRRALSEALHHAAHRSAFGKRLVDQPLMRSVLADLCLEVEAAVALALRLARGFDQGLQDEAQRKFTRLALAAGKYWVTRRAPAVVGEALECLGGNGYVEDGPMARLFRDAPLNSIWEGSGNVQCLDVLRALRKEPDTLDAVLDEIAAARGASRVLDAYAAGLADELGDPQQLQFRARRLAERLALALQATLLLQHAPHPVADAFCAARLAGAGGFGFGTLPKGVDAEAIIARSMPEADRPDRGSGAPA